MDAGLPAQKRVCGDRKKLANFSNSSTRAEICYFPIGNA